MTTLTAEMPPLSSNRGGELLVVAYCRLLPSGHRDRWREAVTDPLTEFR
jgi:hypothetical protein